MLLSDKVYSKLPKAILWLFDIIPIRKVAHISIYTVLSFLTAITLSIKIKHPYFFTVCACYTYACFDELHQYFTLDRGCQFSDTLIDFAGIMIGLLVGIFVINTIRGILRIMRKSNHKKANQEKIEQQEQQEKTQSQSFLAVGECI